VKAHLTSEILTVATQSVWLEYRSVSQYDSLGVISSAAHCLLPDPKTARGRPSSPTFPSMKWSFGRKKQRKPPNRSGSGTEALDKMIEAEGSASGNSESSLVVEPARDRSRRRGAPTNTLCLYDAEREATPVKEPAGGRRVMFAEAPRKSSARQLSSLQREESYRLECSNRQPPTRSMSEEGMASYESLQLVGRKDSSRRLNTMHRQDSYRLERCRQLARSMSEEGMSSYQSLTSPIASMNLTRTESYRLERRKPPARSLSDEAMASPQKSLSSSRTDHTDRAFLESSTMSALTMPSVSSFEKPMVYPGFSTLVSHPKRRASIGATPKEVRVGRQTDPEDASCSSLSTAATKRKTRRRNSISTYTLPISPTRSVASMQSEDDDDEARPPMYSVAQYTTAMKPPADYSSSNGSSHHHRRGGNRRRKPRKIASFHSSSDSDDSSMLHTGWTDTEEEKPKNKGYTVLSKPLNMSTSSMDSMDMSMLQTGWTDNEEEPSKPRCRQTRRNSTSAFQSSVTSTDSLFATGWTDDENENSLLPPRRGRRRASLATTAPMSRRVTNASYLSPTVYQQPKPNIIKNMSVYDKNTFKSTSPALDKRKKVKKDKMRRRNSTSSSTATSVSSTRRRNSLSSTADTTSMYSETGWIVPPPTSDCEDSIFHETGWSPVKTGRRNSISSTYSDELYPQHALYAN